MSLNLKPLLAAAIDGRLHNVIHRQRQLQNLHTAFQQSAGAIREAIVSDGVSTPAEAAVEYFAAIRCIKDAYESLSPEKALDAEYSVAANKNAPDNRVPAGIVYIEAINHTMFYSVVTPLVAAIAAGNCVVVLLPQTLRNSSTLLRNLLSSSMEQDVIAIVNEPLSDSSLPASTIWVQQSGTELRTKSNELVSISSLPVVAVIDRTADVQLAAKELVAARFSFGGRSPYAPDIVLVNEFVQQRFLHAVLQECVSRSAVKKTAQKSGANVSKALEALRKSDEGVRIISQEQAGAVVELPSRKSLLSTRLEAPILAVHSTRSVDDAIELITKIVPEKCNATYHFANPETGKYLAQFISSNASFINHVPRELLLGPLYPAGQPLTPNTRYQPSFFTLPSPQYSTAAPRDGVLKSALSGANDELELMRLASEPLNVKKRYSGKGIGFFEQGLLLNASLILFGTITASIVSIYYVRRALRHH